MNASAIPCNRIYNDLAELLPLVAPPAEYAEEARHWLRVLNEFVPRTRPAVLELGTGGGHNLSHLTAFTTAAAHLAPGGVLIVSPDDFADTFTPPVIGHETYTDGQRRVTWFEYAHDPDPADGTVETIMTFVVEDESGVRIEHDRHVTGLFARVTWLALLARPYELLVGVLS